jgi:hypothetical protein
MSSPSQSSPIKGGLFFGIFYAFKGAPKAGGINRKLRRKESYEAQREKSNSSRGKQL